MGLKKLRKQAQREQRDSQEEIREDVGQQRQKKEQQVQEKTKQKVKQKRRKSVKKQNVQVGEGQQKKQDKKQQTQAKAQQQTQQQAKQQVKPKRRKTLRKQNTQSQQAQSKPKPKKQQMFNDIFSKYREDQEQSKQRYFSEQKDDFNIQEYGKKSKINVDIEQLQILQKKKQKKIKKPKQIKVKNKYFSDFSSLDQQEQGLRRDQQRDITELEQEPKFELEYQKRQPKKVSNFEMISKRINDIKDKRQFKVENDPKMKDKIKKTLNNVQQDTQEVEINVAIPNVFAKKTASGALYLKNTTSQHLQSQQHVSRTNNQMLQSHNNATKQTNPHAQPSQPNPQNKKKKGINRSQFYSTLTNQIKIKNHTKISSQQVKQCFKTSELKDDEFDFQLIEDIKSHSMSRSSNGSVSSRGSRESRENKSNTGESMGQGMDSKKNNGVFEENSNRFGGGELSNTHTVSKKNSSMNRPPTFTNSLNNNNKPTSNSNLLLKRTNSQNSIKSSQNNQNSNSNSLGFRSNANARKAPFFISQISQVHESQTSSIQNGDSLNYKSTNINIMRQKQKQNQKDQNSLKQPFIKSEMQIKHSNNESNNLSRQNHLQLKLNPQEVKRQYESTYNLFDETQRVQIIKNKTSTVTESVIIIKNPKNKAKKFVLVEERKTVVGKKFNNKGKEQKGNQKIDQPIKYTQLVKQQSQVDPSKIDFCVIGPKTGKNSKSTSQNSKQSNDYNQKNEKSQSLHTDLNSNLINDPGRMDYSNSFINSHQHQNIDQNQDKYNSNLISFKNQQQNYPHQQSQQFQQQQIIEDFNSNSKIQVQQQQQLQKPIRKKEKGKKKNKKNKNKKSGLDSYFQDEAEFSSDEQGHTSGQQTDQEQDADQNGQLNGLIDRQGGYELNKNLVMRKYQEQIQKDEEKMIQKILKNLHGGKKKHEETQSQKRMRLRMKQAEERFKEEDKEEWQKINRKETGPIEVPQKLEIENQNEQQMQKKKLQQLQQQIKRPKLEQQPQINTQLNIFQNFKPNIPKRSTLIHRPLINKQTLPPVSIRHQPKKTLVDNKRNSVINQKRKSLDNTVIDLQANKNKVQKTKSIELGIIDSHQNIEIEIDQNQENMENNNSRRSGYNNNGNSRYNNSNTNSRHSTNKDVEI